MANISVKMYILDPRRLEPIQVVYGSNSIGIEVELMDYDIPSTATAKVYSQPDGRTTSYVQNNVTISGNKLSFVPDVGFFEPGSNRLQFDITVSNKHVITFMLRVQCAGKLGDGSASVTEVLPYVERAETAKTGAETAQALAETAATTATNAKNSILSTQNILNESTEIVNLFEITAGTSNGITCTKTADGFKFSGTATAKAVFECCTLPAGQYTGKFVFVSGTISTTSALSVRYGASSGERWLNSSNLLVTNTFASETRVFIAITSGTTVTDMVIGVQINSGSTVDRVYPYHVSAVDHVARTNATEAVSNLNDYLYKPGHLLEKYGVHTSVNRLHFRDLAGKTVITFGDSITAGSADRTPWVDYFATMTGCTIINKAVGGALFGESVRESNYWISTQISKPSAGNWESASCVIVAAGTNDAGYGTDMEELKAKVQSAITAIRAKKANIPILFVTPLRRGTSPTDSKLMLIPYISAIIENVAVSNQCSVVCGMEFPIPSYTDGLIDGMSADNLHPNATGAYVYAQSLIGAIC